MVMVTPASSLRERSKYKRRRAIQRAALVLFAERGYDGATIAEIAEAAEVAPRTVTLYFPTKLDMAMSVAEDTAASLASIFHANPEQSFTEVVDRWLLGEGGAVDLELAAATRAMFDANPPLKATFGARIAEAASVGAAALTAEVGLPPASPLLPIVSAVVSAALAAYVDAAAAAATPEVHQSFLRFLRAIIAAARPAEAAIAQR